MANIKRLSIILSTSCAGLALAACDGASSVASPGAGTVVVNPPAPAPTPTPTVTPTPTPITAAQFAVLAGQPAGTPITADEQLALLTAAPSANNNASGTNPFTNNAQPFATSNTLPTATDPLTLNALGASATPGNPNGTAFFQAGSFLGAFSSATDNSWQGWTCNSSSVNFGTTGTTAGCASVPGTPAASGTAPAATICPTGTTAATLPVVSGVAGVVNNRRLCRINPAITTNTTLPNIPGVVYQLDGPTEVGVDTGPTGTKAGGVVATLTIEPGVVIAANSSDTANDVLLVNRGSQIQAVGTATAPIIFTAQQNLTNNNVGDNSQGLWGGIILLGQAPVGVCRTGTGPNTAAGTSTDCENQIEGVATPRFYGGNVQASNSGRFQFVQIRFTGVSISEGNELQGLTLGGTGSGTLIDHVQSHNSADDGIEIFGGTSNLRYVALTGADDDGLDFDNGWRGNVQFLVIAQKGSATSDSFAFEVDSDNNEDLLPRTFGLISNFTVVQVATAPAAFRLRGGADVRFVNGIVKSNSPCINVVSAVADRTTVRAANSALQDQGPPAFNSIYFACNNR